MPAKVNFLAGRTSLLAGDTETLQLLGQGARSSGVNFAIGVDVVRECVPRLIVYGTSSGVSAPRARAPMAA